MTETSTLNRRRFLAAAGTGAVGEGSELKAVSRRHL